MNKFKSVFIFTMGVACGAAVAWATTKQKYEQILEEEIKSVKETYKNRQALVVNEVKEDNESDGVVEDKEEITVEDKEEYNSIIENNGYVNYSKYMNGNKEEKEVKEETAVDDDRPYIIEPEEFGEDGYDTQTLTYYADGVLVDDLDDIVDSPDTVVGLDNLSVLDEFGANSVMVRNDIWKVDFEIIKDDWNYSDLNQEIPSKEEMKEYYSNVEKDKKPHEM